MGLRPSGRWPAVLLTLILGACSTAPPDPGPAAPQTEATTEAPDANEGSQPASEGKAKKADGRRDKTEKKEAAGSSSESGGTAANGSGAEAQGSSDGEAASQDPQGDAATTFPAPGTYTYDQKGYEDFCQGASCSRNRLPDTQPVEYSVRNRSEQRTIVVTDARPSENRTARTTFEYRQDEVLVTEFSAQVSYGGFEFSNTYRPQPPVQALRLPLRSGESWSGKWKAETSGTYSVSVGDQETVLVGGKKVSAFRIDTLQTFEGEFDGKGAATVWLDPHTHAVVKSQGKLDVKSNFGRYVTAFQIALRAGPGYR